MAANLAGDAADRLLRIQTWREKAVHDISHYVGQPNSIAAQLCLECITFYRYCLRQLSQNNRLAKPTFTRLSRNFETLALWAHGYNIAHGGLDESLLSSRRTRRCYFESLTSLCSTLLSRLPQCCSISELGNEAESLRRTLDAGIICLEDTYQDGDSTASSRSSRLAGYDSIDEVINDLEVDVDGLIAMDSLITCPADRTMEPKLKGLTAWAPHHAICERVANRFPMAEESVVERLGRATWDSFLRCKELRERSLMRDHDEEYPEVVENTPALPAKTVATSARSKDSGLGSSLPTSYAETIMSYQRQGGESVKVPPLPKSAADGVPFDCIVCGRNIVARTNSAWKNHLFNDLRPYICTFEACSRASPFESRQMWVSHTMNHVMDMPGPLDSDSAVVKCPLCLEDMRPGDAKHLGAHLEEIALGAVTLHAEVDSDRSSAAGDEEEGDEESNFSRDSADLLERVMDLNKRFTEKLLPQCLEFTANPPSDPWARQNEFHRLKEQVVAQVILNEDLDTRLNDRAKSMRVDLVKNVHKVLHEMDMRVPTDEREESKESREQPIPASMAAHDTVQEEQLADVQSDVSTQSSWNESDSENDDDHQEFLAEKRKRNRMNMGSIGSDTDGENHAKFHCDMCDKAFTKLANLEEHKDSHLERWYACTTCGKVFAKANDWMRHEKQHVGQGKQPLERMQEAGVGSNSGKEDLESSDSWTQLPRSSALKQIRGADRGTSNREGRDERREEREAWLCCACQSGPCSIVDPLCRNENCQHERCETCRTTPLTYPGLPTNEHEAKVLATVDKDGYLVTELGSKFAGRRDEVLDNLRRDSQHVQALEQAFAANPQPSEKDIEDIAKERAVDIPRVTRWFQSRVALEESKKTVLAKSADMASTFLTSSAIASVPEQPIDTTNPLEELVEQTAGANPSKPAHADRPAATSGLHGKDRGPVTKAPMAVLQRKEVLEQQFSRNPKPSSGFKEELASDLGIDVARVNNWFQNRRAIEKREREREREHTARDDSERLRGRLDPPERQPDGDGAVTIMERTTKWEFVPYEPSKRDSHQRDQSPPHSKEKYDPEDSQRLIGRFDGPVQQADNHPAPDDNARGKRVGRVGLLSKEQKASAFQIRKACDACRRRKIRCTHCGPLQASFPAGGIAQPRMRPDAEHQPTANLLVDVGSSDEKTLRSEATEHGSVYPSPVLPWINEALGGLKPSNGNQSGNTSPGASHIGDLNPMAWYLPPPPAYDASSGWDPSQDRALIAARIAGQDWAQIQAGLFPDKTSDDCRHRYQRLMLHARPYSAADPPIHLR